MSIAERDEIAKATGLPVVQVEGINARMKYRASRRLLRMHEFRQNPHEAFLECCIDCGEAKDSERHLTAKDLVDRASDRAWEEGQ
jgi:hypothetical protein